jgi:hypothetical protein
VTARWTDLENSLAAQVATEPTFQYVAAAAKTGLVTPDAFPSAVICVLAGKTVQTSAIAGVRYSRKTIEFQVLLSTRLSGNIGESRLTTGGIWELYDLLSAKLLGFVPLITSPTVAVWPITDVDFYLDRLEEGGVDLNTLWSVDVEIQNPIAP